MTAELIDTQGKETFWSDRYDRPLSDMFAIQAAVFNYIVSAIEPVNLHREQRISSEVAQQDLQHWDLLMRTRRHVWRTTPEHAVKAQAPLQQAVTLKPNDSPSLSLLAFTNLAKLWGVRAEVPRALVAQANRLTLVAVCIDERDSQNKALSGRRFTLQSFNFGHSFVQASHREKFLLALSNAGWRA